MRPPLFGQVSLSSSMLSYRAGSNSSGEAEDWLIRECALTADVAFGGWLLDMELDLLDCRVLSSSS